MKTSLASLVLSVSIFGSVPAMEASPDRWQTLRAINWVENPHNHSKPGRHGELGPYQFRPATWRMHTQRPFSHAIQRGAADEVAVKHYEWIKAALERNRIDVTPFNIAMAWNCGVTAVVAGRAPQASFRYASRVLNLVEALRERANQPDASVAQSAGEVGNHERASNREVLFKIKDVDANTESAGGESFRVFPTKGPRFVLAAG